MLKNIISEDEDSKPLCINFEENFLGLIKMILSRSFSTSNYLRDNRGDLQFYDLNAGFLGVCASLTHQRVLWTHMTFLGCSKRQKYAKLELFSKSRIHDHTFQNGVKSSLASVNIFVHHETKLNRIYFHCGTSQRLYMLVSTVAFQGWHIGYGICPGIPLI